MRFNLSNLGSILAYGLSAIGLICSLLVLLAGDESLDANVGASIWVTIIMFLVAIAVAVFSSVHGILINPASLRGAVIGVGSLLVIVLVCYLISSGSDYESYKNISESGSRWVSTGLNATYIMTVIAAGTVLYSSLHRLGK